MVDIPPSTIILQALRDLTIIAPANSAKGTAWRGSVGTMPDEGDDFITIYDTSPVTDGRLMRSGLHILHPGIMFMVRSREYTPGYQKGRAIEKALEVIKNLEVTVDSVAYLFKAWTVSTPLTHIDQQQKNVRQIFTINGTVTLSEV